MNHGLTKSTAQFNKIFNELQKYKKENKKLKKELNRLQTENKFRNQLLDEKSKHIISCISESIALRKEVESLTQKLNSSQKKKKKKTKRSKKIKESTNQHQPENFNNQLPYLVLEMPNQSAHMLSLPCSPTLKTIEENNTTSPILNASNNNRHIYFDEWSESIATISPAKIMMDLSDISDISDVDDAESQVSMHTSRISRSTNDYYRQEEDHLTLTLTYSSGYYSGTSDHGIELPQITPRPSNIFSDEDDDEIIEISKKQTNDEHSYEFPIAISVLSELNDVENNTSWESTHF